MGTMSCARRKCVTSSPRGDYLHQDRSLLKNLALWLGRITLARNKPILHRDLNVKELLLEGYESGRLVACVSFVAKVCLRVHAHLQTPKLV